jgi:hypothetical protein
MTRLVVLLTDPLEKNIPIFAFSENRIMDAIELEGLEACLRNF